MRTNPSHPRPRVRSLNVKALVLGASILCTSLSSADKHIGLNFSENDGNQNWTNATDLIGPLMTPTGFFNNANNPPGAPLLPIRTGTLAAGGLSGLVEYDPNAAGGAATTANVTWTSSNAWYSGSGVATNDARLSVGYLDDGGTGVNITVDTLPYERYNVYIIVASDQGADPTYTARDINVNGTPVIGGTFTAFRNWSPTSANGVWTEADAATTGNYIVARDQTGDPLVIQGQPRNGAERCSIAGVIIERFAFVDTDGDGLEDSVETGPVGGPPGDYNGPNDTGTDPQNPDSDGDGVDDGTEVELGSNPTIDDDTDGDGVNNLAETTGTTYGTHGTQITDPLDTDSDDDTLTDGQELAGENPGGASHGFGPTNPNALDSDGDTFTDPGELLVGSDPNVGGTVPTAGTSRFISVNFTGGRSAINVGVISTNGTATMDDTAGLLPHSGWNNLGGTTQFLAPVLDADGVTVSTNVSVSGVPNTWSIDGTIDNSAFGVGFPHDGNAALMQGYLDTTATSTTTVEVNDIVFPVYDVIVYLDGVTADRFGDYTVNGVPLNHANHGVGWDIINGGGTFARQYSPDQATVGNFIVFHGVTGSQMTLTATPNGGFRAPIQAIEILNAGPDTDGDGIPDNTEEVILGTNPAVSDIGVDDDSDGSDNVQEFLNLTGIGLPDTDNDGVSDGIEGAGSTDALDADSDDDGLADGGVDGEDVNGDGIVDPTETDPTDPDTDGDTIDDGTEVAAGKDPLDANDDFDDDGIGNTDEIDGTLNVNYNSEPTDLLNPDSDGDGLADLADINAGANPNDADTDKDNLEDGFEATVTMTDPLDIADPGVVASAIGINFVSDQQAGVIGALDVVGHPDYLQSGWNNTIALAAPAPNESLEVTEFDIDSPTIGLFTDSTGTILSNDGTPLGTPTMMMISSSGTRYSTFNGTGSLSSLLMNGYVDANNGGGGTQIEFEGIPYAYYDLVVYVGSDGNGRDARLEVEDYESFALLGQAGYQSNAAQGGFTAFDYVVSNDTTGLAYPPATVVVFRALSSDHIILRNVLVGANTGIMGVQFVETTEPVAELKIVDFTQVGASTFEIGWAGGSGSDTIQSSLTGEPGTWTDVAVDVASPQTVTGTAATELFRIVTP